MPWKTVGGKGLVTCRALFVTADDGERRSLDQASFRSPTLLGVIGGVAGTCLLALWNAATSPPIAATATINARTAEAIRWLRRFRSRRRPNPSQASVGGSNRRAACSKRSWLIVDSPSFVASRPARGSSVPVQSQ